jgi:beta-mannosidase
VNTPESVSYTRYAEDMGRFISEFGLHAAPVPRTLRTVIPDDQLYHHSPSMDWHNKDNPKNKGDNLMLGVTGLPETLDEYIDFSMIAQAEGLKFGVEHYRRRMPHCSGTLVWQLNDCWPVLSWSVLDYYGVGKAGYFYLRRAYAQVLASFKSLPDGAVELWITNDTGTPFEDSIAVRLGAFDGTTIWEERHAVAVAPRTSRAVHRWYADRVPPAPERYLWVQSQDARFEPNRHFFAAIKDLQRVRPVVEVRAFARGAHEVQLELHAPSYAYFVHLLASDPATRFSDNYFDLPPGGRAIIRVTNRHVPLRPEDLTVAWR